MEEQWRWKGEWRWKGVRDGGRMEMEEGRRQRRDGAEPGAGLATCAASPGPLCALPHVRLLQAQETTYGTRPGRGRMGGERPDTHGTRDATAPAQVHGIHKIIPVPWLTRTKHVPEPPPMKGDRDVCAETP